MARAIINEFCGTNWKFVARWLGLVGGGGGGKGWRGGGGLQEEYNETLKLSY